MNKTKMLSTIGLAQRAACLSSGEDMVLDSIRKHHTHLVFLASDAGPSTAKRVSDKCAFYNVSLIRSFSGEELSHAIGKGNRKVVAVTDPKLAILLSKTANEE
jgi:ribosomal protein L7Ae-like RNA K-turn-binding protein